MFLNPAAFMEVAVATAGTKMMMEKLDHPQGANTDLPSGPIYTQAQGQSNDGVGGVGGR